MTIFSARNLCATLAAAAAGLYSAAPALADEVPANSARIGLYSVFYHVSADDLSGPYVPPGANIDAKNVETLYLAYVRRLSSHFDVELAAGYPPLQKTVGKGPATLGSVPYDGQVIATAAGWRRRCSLNTCSSARIRSFVRTSAPASTTPLSTTAIRPRRAMRRAAVPPGCRSPPSVGPAGTAGLAYNIAGNWNLYASYSVSQVKTKLEADTAGVIRTTHISFGPQALVVSVGYSF